MLVKTALGSYEGFSRCKQDGEVLVSLRAPGQITWWPSDGHWRASCDSCPSCRRMALLWYLRLLHHNLLCRSLNDKQCHTCQGRWAVSHMIFYIHVQTWYKHRCTNSYLLVAVPPFTHLSLDCYKVSCCCSVQVCTGHRSLTVLPPQLGIRIY